MPGDIPLIDVVVFVSSAHTTGEDNSKKLKMKQKYNAKMKQGHPRPL